MALELTVAFIGDPEDPFRRTASEDEWERPYRDRPTVRLAVDEDVTLAYVLERATAMMGLEPPDDAWQGEFDATHNKVAFYKPEDEEAFEPRHLPRYLMAQLTLVDDRGRAIFGVQNMRAVRYRDLLRAAEAGTLDGDPLRPYLIIEPGYGDVPPPDWVSAWEGIKVAREVLQIVGEAGGAVAAGKLAYDLIRDRLRKGDEAVEANPEWAHRGLRPYQFVALIRSRDWTAAELAAILGCSERDAEGILWVLGFAFDEETGQWMYGGDDAAQAIQAIHTEIAIAGHRGGEDWRAELRRRLTAFAETGDPPGIDFEREPEDEGEFVYEYGPSVGERVGEVIDGFLGLLRRGLDRRRR